MFSLGFIGRTFLQAPSFRTSAIQSYRAVPFCLLSPHFVVLRQGSPGTQTIHHNCLPLHLHRPAQGWEGQGSLAVGSLWVRPGATGRRSAIFLATPIHSRVPGVEFGPDGARAGSYGCNTTDPRVLTLC